MGWRQIYTRGPDRCPSSNSVVDPSSLETGWSLPLTVGGVQVMAGGAGAAVDVAIVALGAAG